jgi:hypothetical protein
MGSIRVNGVEFAATHPAWVDSVIHNPEFKLGALTYVTEGHIPKDHFWLNLHYREELNPAGFYRNNPQYVGFFDPPAVIGNLPRNNIIFEFMLLRKETHPLIFQKYHPFWGDIIRPPEMPPGGGGGIVPAPTSSIMFLIGIFCVAFWTYFLRRR